MQLAQETQKVVRSGQFNESKFKIEASSKAFQILSSRLYADEFKAIVRELCTNASDAHAAAGKSDVPIVVHSPDYMDNSFSVRDFGNGVDPAEFEKIYTTYFYSTKTDSNEEVGCFGLGSKSPFAYAKQFTVENHYQGNKYIYSCFINENTEPSVTLLTTSPTTESGVKVSFPVNRSDWNNFQSAITSVLQWFDVTPKCNFGIQNNSFKEQYKVIQNTNYASFFSVRMGQVVYPCKQEYFEDVFGNGISIVFNVNIGDVDITPSRESLEYRTKTIYTLNKLRDQVYNTIHSEVQDIINDTCITKFARFKGVHEYCDSKNLSKLKHKIISTSFGNGYISNYSDRIDESKYPSIVAFSNSGWRNKVEKTKSYMYVTNKSILLVKDKAHAINKKVEHLLSQSRGSNVILIPSEDKDKFIAEYDLKESDITYATKVDLPKDMVVAVKTNSNNCCSLSVENGLYIKRGNRIEKDLKDQMYITEQQFNSLFGEYSGRHTHAIDFRKIHNKKGNPKVYIFTDLQYQNLKIQNRNFTNFLDHLVKEIEDNKKDVIEFIASDAVINDYSHEKLISIADKSTTNNLYKQYVEFHKNGVTSTDPTLAAYYEGIMSLIQRHAPELYKEVETAINVRSAALQELRVQAEKKYPLVKILVDNSNFNDIINDVVTYVDLIEKEGK